ncbi:hypothetical protein L208DRAFT_1407901 [Tricholoma matsutake]|nr:hypothetical protein L208DRAFT_1407901 [Tricholoma matsutake 945]
MNLPHAKRKYTEEEKQHLLANLDIEVAHRTRQFESWLSDRLENFNMHQEGQVSRIPKQVRNMKMREFGEKYNGNVQAALRGFQKEKFVAAGGEGTLGELDKVARKRKWVASQEVDSVDSKDHDSSKAPKNARTAQSPKKMAGSSTGPGTAQRARLFPARNKTPGTSRTMGRVPPSPSPYKLKPPFNSNFAYTAQSQRPPSRPTSPAKHPTGRQGSTIQPRVLSSSTFNPSLPPKTPIYPGSQDGVPPPTLRLPRTDENMLSMNGSPLANPYEYGMGWFRGMGMADTTSDEEDGNDGNDSIKVNGVGEPRTLKRSKSSIVIRRDPSVAFPGSLNGMHSRTNSQASLFTGSSQPTSSAHSRENSQSVHYHPNSQPRLPSDSLYPPPLPASHSQSIPPDVSNLNAHTTPRPNHSRSFSALVAIPMKDGHLLEFDPLQTSPGTLDALDGITDSAKKHARAEMGRLVQAAVDKWKIR